MKVDDIIEFMEGLLGIINPLSFDNELELAQQGFWVTSDQEASYSYI